MLRELHISNLAVIEDATVEFEPGLNVFTGQTGAGKSLVIGAFEALIGLRKATDMIRPGADEARISGVFEADSPALAAALTAALDQTIEPGDEMLITRKLFASGRSSLSVNGQPATAAMMRRAADLLVDIHGQHDHQFLLKPSNQLTILDAFAGCADERETFASAFAERRELLHEKQELAASATLRKQQLELYEFQADEIDAAELQLGEFPELQARENVLGNVQKIKGEAGAAHAALYDAEGSVTERLQAITHLMIDLAEMDPSLESI
ncbi:MAG: AAA family ATPase, partial [Planctomycetota bacterium]